MKRSRINPARLSKGPVQVTFVNPQAAGSQAAISFFIANRAMEVVYASENHTTKEATAGTLTLDIVKDASGDAAGTSTTSVLASTFDGKAANATPQQKAGSATLASKRLAAGDRLTLKPSAAGTELTGVSVTVELKYL